MLNGGAMGTDWDHNMRGVRLKANCLMINIITNYAGSGCLHNLLNNFDVEECIISCETVMGFFQVNLYLDEIFFNRQDIF